MPSAGHCGRHHNYRCRICEIKFPNSYNSDWTPQDAEEMEAQLSTLKAQREWVRIKDDGELPDIGVPVLLCINGIVQHETWMRDATIDECTDWFEPYGEVEPEHCIDCTHASHWQYLPPAPEGE